MIARRSRRRDGLTLIEILLALIVMVLGFCGILALFPPALQSSRESMEATNAAILGESVAHALTTSLQFATFNASSQQYEAILTHDLKSGATTNRYRFALPKLAPPGNPMGGWRHYPSKVNPPSPDLGAPMTASWAPEEDDRLFTLDGDTPLDADGIMEKVERFRAYKRDLLAQIGLGYFFLFLLAGRGWRVQLAAAAGTGGIEAFEELDVRGDDDRGVPVFGGKLPFVVIFVIILAPIFSARIIVAMVFNNRIAQIAQSLSEYFCVLFNYARVRDNIDNSFQIVS